MESKMREISKGLLDGACGYLSGPMEFVADHGVAWRRKFIKLSKEAGLKIDYIDPTNKPGGKNIKIGENKAEQEKMQVEGQWSQLQRYVHAYRRYDLRFVDISDFIVAVIDSAIPQWGTGNEIYTAESQHKPMFFICDSGLSKLPRWLFDVIEIGTMTDGHWLHNGVAHSNVYQSVEEVIEQLKQIDRNASPMCDKWVLVRRELERMRLESEPDTLPVHLL
jgi:hypothetical protein